MDPTPEHTHEYAEGAPATARLSMFAAAALALALLSLIGGCGSLALAMMVTPKATIAVMIAPILGLLAAVLGFLSLRQIERANGAIIGRPVGLAGMFLGILAAAVLGFMAMAAMLTLVGSRPLAPIAAELVASMQDGQPARAREILSQEASDDLTAQRLGAFGGSCRTSMGNVTGSEAGFDLIYEARRVVSRSPSSVSMSVSDRPRPVWILFNDQKHFAYIFVNQQAVQGKQIRIDDMLVFVDVNKVLVLREFGRAQVLSDGMGWEIAGP